MGLGMQAMALCCFMLYLGRPISRHAWRVRVRSSEQSGGVTKQTCLMITPYNRITGAKYMCGLTVCGRVSYHGLRCDVQRTMCCQGMLVKWRKPVPQRLCLPRRLSHKCRMSSRDRSYMAL